MYTRNNKNGKILNILLGIITLFIIIFIIAWVVNKGANTSNYDAEFKNNLETVHETAKEYFADELPEEIGDTNLVSLEEMYDLELTDELSYGKTSCDTTLSYISITKINSKEYKVKTNLVCGSKSDNIVEKIETNTVIEEENGDVIIDAEKDNVDLEVNQNNGSTNNQGTNSNNTVDCFGPVCTFKQIETTCKTTYEYEYVKRNVSCESGYSYVNGTCVAEKIDTVNPTPNYSEEKVIVSDALVNKGSSYRRYTDPIVSGGDIYYYCTTGTLKNGYCYTYANKIEESDSYCPSGYTRSGNTCYKYADLISSGSSSCPNGYTKKNNACYKYADPIISNSTTCPSGYTKSGNTCYIKTSVSNSCPSGYTQNGNACYKYADLITNSNTTYSCPNGYTTIGSGSSMQCLKTASAVKKYTEWGNPDNTYSTSTKESTYENELSKKVLVGSNKVGVTTVYTYSIYSRKSYYYCAQGTLSGTKCNIYSNPTANTSSTSTCPSGYTKSGNTCYIKTNVSNTCPSGYTQNGSSCYKYADLITSGSSTCPSGYTKSGNTCYIKTDMIYSDNSYCPSGYTRQGSSNVCYKTANLITNSSSTCPSGYTDNGTNCYSRTKAKTTTSAKTYSCPSGYNQSGSGANTTCYKTYYSSDTYYCENANAQLKGTKCYLTVPSQYTGSTCPSGYTPSGDICTKTTTITSSPIWSNANYIYSSATYLEGYQKTGVAKFVTKCTPVEEIHYK